MYEFIQNVHLLYVQIISSIIHVIVFIILIKTIYLEDKKRLKLYTTLKESGIFPVMVNGITNIEENDIDHFNDQLTSLLNINKEINHKMFSFISYNEHVIEFGIIFLHSTDSILFLEDKQLDQITMEENEFVGNGDSLKFIIKSPI